MVVVCGGAYVRAQALPDRKCVSAELIYTVRCCSFTLFLHIIVSCDVYMRSKGHAPSDQRTMGMVCVTDRPLVVTVCTHRSRATRSRFESTSTNDRSEQQATHNGQLGWVMHLPSHQALVVVYVVFFAPIVFLLHLLYCLLSRLARKQDID